MRLVRATWASALQQAPADPDPELLAERDRLTERFAQMQAELGGLFYEMAIRDHVVMEVLIEKAAALQRVDEQLAQVERQLTPAEVHNSAEGESR